MADEELATIATQWSPELAAVVVLDPATGEVLANAGQRGGKAVDVATTVAMDPGSTVKPITIAAALELHAITVDQKFACGPNPRTYGDKALEDAHSSETLDLAHLLAVSSNIGTSHIFDALGGDNLVQWLHRFHFGEAPALRGAAAGAVPARVGTGSLEGALLAVGEGLSATPLQMVAAYGAIADDGVYHAPTLDRGGSAAERVLSAETARSVMGLLETVVTDQTGTGTAARVEGVMSRAKPARPSGRRRTGTSGPTRASSESPTSPRAASWSSSASRRRRATACPAGTRPPRVRAAREADSRELRRSGTARPSRRADPLDPRWSG